ncbi:MAG: tRNA (N6-threonylcarbamoyladenosine(37)-N6)-methyltransferase TrmO [bacterium]
MHLIEYKAIGIIHSPFMEPKGTPIQPAAGKEIKGAVEVFPEYAEGLADINGFSHIILIYHFHLSRGWTLKAKPFMDDREHGIFSIRAPRRPNSIGTSTVQLMSVEENILHIQDLDIVDGTPLLDIKPFVPRFDNRETEKTGWLKDKIRKLPESRDDGRFASGF